MDSDERGIDTVESKIIAKNNNQNDQNVDNTIAEDDDINNQNCRGDVGDAWGTNPPTYNKLMVAKMPVDKHSLFYNMSHKNRGLAIIFNHEKFEIPVLKERTGTKVDCQRLEHTFKKLHFQVDVQNDLTSKMIEKKAFEVSRMDHTNNDCLVVIILSHGEHGIIYSSNDSYKLEDILQCFTADNCPTLAGKPKIFIIQACQGDKLDGGVILARTETDGLPVNSYTIPTYADFLVAYSTMPGYFSWRNTSRGSWFIQSLCEELNENAHKYHLLDILTLVSRRVAIDFESNNPDNIKMHKQKQIPCLTSMLMRFIIFHEKVAK